MRIVCLGGIGMVLGGPDACAVRKADDPARSVSAPGPVPHPGCMAEDLVEGWQGESLELKLGHRHHASHGQAHEDSGYPQLREGGVKHPVRAELVLKASG